MIRSPLRLFVLALTAVVAALVLPATAQAAPYCGITWGSLDKSGGSVAPASADYLTDVRAGRHECYDRLVLDIRGSTSINSWQVSYENPVTAQGSGNPVPLRGGAFLQITVGATDHDDAGRLTYAPANRRELVNVTGYRTFRQVAWAGEQEGRCTVGLGVRARLPFRVLTLAVPGFGVRVVVDVAHAW
jgi:hypothetical protein